MNKKINPFKDLFISYGRRESLGFVGRLHQRLKLLGYDGWFDKVNIPDGDDYAQRINHGIESAHNFVYVMAPRCLTSPYCLIELEYARLLGKRVIPINQMVIFDTPEKNLSQGDKQVLIGFYKFYNLPDQNINTTQNVLNRSHTLIGRTDWLDAKEKVSDDDCQRLVEWAQPYENNWAKHENLDDLKSFEFPIFGESIDALDGVVERIIAVLERQKNYVHRHTEILSDALHWEKNQKATHHLLVGKERTAAEDWLLTEFLPPKQPPCKPSVLVCDFICEARKNAFNRMTDVFICYDVHDQNIQHSVIQSLSRYAITTWSHDRDIQKGTTFERVIEVGIENADNFFYFISPLSITSDYCQKELAHALKYNKRIVPLLIAPTPEPDIPEVLRELQYVDFTDNTCQADYDSDIDDILNILRLDHEYYQQHKVFLARALKWKIENQKPSFLLRGHNLENAKTWLRLNDKREQHPPLPLHHELISASEAAKGQLGTEVFISYSRKNSDFARYLNSKLQEAGKTTWFDQESISTGVDFENEIFKGIDSADNFLFVLSPDAVESEYCEREVNYALEHSKRFITVLRREIEPTTIPEALRVINWIDFKDSPFDKSFPELIQAIELDREHAHQHTVLQQRASDWAENDRSHDFLLNITACANAESWRDTALSENKQPAPTQLQQAFIQQSRKAIEAAERKERRQRHIIFASITGVTVMAVILAIFTVLERNNAQNLKKTLFESRLTRALLLTQSENYADSKQALRKTYDLKEIPAPRRHARNLLDRFDKIMGGAPQQVYQGAEEQLETVVISPDGLKLVTGGWNGTLAVFDSNTGQLLQRFKEGGKTIVDIVFHPQGKWLASVAEYDNRIVFWSLATGKKTHEWPIADSKGRAYALAISSDGTYLASNSNSHIILWHLETGKSRILTGHESSILQGGLAFHPTKPLLASASYKEKIAILWDVNTGKILHQFKPTGQGENSITFSPNGKYLATGCYDKMVCLWDIQTGEQWRMLQGHKNKVSGLHFSANGQYLVSASWDQTLRLWDIESGVTLRVLQGHTDRVSAVTTYAEQLFSASHDETVIRWNMDLPYQQNVELPNLAVSSRVAPDGASVAVGFDDGSLRLYSLPNFTLLLDHKQAHTEYVAHIAFSSDSRLLASAGFLDNTAKVWQLQAKQLRMVKTFPHPSKIEDIALSPEGKTLATAISNGQIGLFTIATEQKHFYKAHQGPVYSVDFDARGTRLVSGGADGYTHLWNINDEPPTLLQTFPRAINEIHDTTFSPDDQWIASAGMDPVVHIYETKNGQERQQLAGHEDTIFRAFFSPDNHQIVTISIDNTVRIWDWSRGNALFTLRLPLYNQDIGNFDFYCFPQNCWLAVSSFYPTPKLMRYELGPIYETSIFQQRCSE